MPLTQKKPNLFHALRLRCPYCGVTKFQSDGSFFNFRDGCQICDYKFEREVGYFSGAAWMITYAVAAVLAMMGGGIMVWKFSDMGDFVVAGIPALCGGVGAMLFIPWGRAIWLYVDHRFHRLDDADRLSTAHSGSTP